jgi:alpha-tubulin suppressor-like RCC1 family protein
MKLLRLENVADGLRFQSISAGHHHTCGVAEDGAAWCWGLNEHGQLGDGTSEDARVPVRVAGGLAFQEVGAGRSHTCGVTTAERPHCWGSNAHGELGIVWLNGPGEPGRDEPEEVYGDRRYRTVQAGYVYSCGIDVGERAHCWGRGLYGQLGPNLMGNVTTPRFVDHRLSFAQVGMGRTHTCGRTTEGAVYCWGTGDFGQLGEGREWFSDVLVRVMGPQ